VRNGITNEIATLRGFSDPTLSEHLKKVAALNPEPYFL
jgi:hypothetical protein